jgi:cytidylate kinase
MRTPSCSSPPAPQVRARRRCHELQSLGLNVHYDDVLADIHARDERDASRAAAPLVPASDAMIIDTSALGVEEAVAAALSAVQERAPTA